MRVRVAGVGIGWQRREFRLEIYIGLSQGQEAIRCWLRMRSGTAGLFADKKRCGLCECDVWHVIRRK